MKKEKNNLKKIHHGKNTHEKNSSAENMPRKNTPAGKIHMKTSSAENMHGKNTHESKMHEKKMSAHDKEEAELRRKLQAHYARHGPAHILHDRLKAPMHHNLSTGNAHHEKNNSAENMHEKNIHESKMHEKNSSAENLHEEKHHAHPLPIVHASGRNTSAEMMHEKNSSAEDMHRKNTHVFSSQRDAHHGVPVVQMSSSLKNGPEKKEGVENKSTQHSDESSERVKVVHGFQILEKYEVEADGAKATIEIRKEPDGVRYHLLIPEISQATNALLMEIRNELISVTTVSMKELTDPTAFLSIKDRFLTDAQRLLRKKLPNLDSKVEKFFVGVLIQEMLGLGKIEFFVNDPNLEEIVIPSAKEPIRIFSKKYGWLLSNITIDREEDILNYSNIIARRVGRQITVLTPLLDAHLTTGDRINAVLYPINTKGNTITIRKFARDPFTIIDFINNKTCSAEIAALLWLAIEYEMNVLISGGTGSGKTSFLNACMPFVPPNQRVISIEDTRELMLPEFLYWTPLVTRTSNAEGRGEVSMLDLLVNSLRMRPDRIILGEMRKQQEAMVLFEAMHTGHSVYATVHADSSAETISRLVNPPLSIPANLLKSVNLNVVMFRDRRRGIRRTFQVSEFEASAAGAHANVLYRWVPEEDRMIRHSESSRFFEDISKHTGMSEFELNEDLNLRQTILLWVAKNNVRSLEDFGKIMNVYYRNKPLLMQTLHTNTIKSLLQH